MILNRWAILTRDIIEYLFLFVKSVGELVVKGSGRAKSRRGTECHEGQYLACTFGDWGYRILNVVATVGCRCSMLEYSPKLD